MTRPVTSLAARLCPRLCSGAESSCVHTRAAADGSGLASGGPLLLRQLPDAVCRRSGSAQAPSGDTAACLARNTSGQQRTRTKSHNRKNNETCTLLRGFPGGTGGKEPAWHCRDERDTFGPRVKKIPGGGRDLKVRKNGSVFNQILFIIGSTYKALNTVDV